MKGTRYYIVAEHTFCVKAADNNLALMQNYEPFRTAPIEDLLFGLTVTDGSPVDYIEEWRQDEEGQDTICGHTEQGEPVFEFRFGGKTAPRLTTP